MDNGASSYRRFLEGDDSGIVEICLLMNKSTSANLNLYFRNTKGKWEFLFQRYTT